MDRLKDVLEENLSRLNLKKRVKENLAVLAWDEIAGQELARQTSAGYISDGVLFVNVKSPAWAHQLTFLKGQLITKLAAKTGSGVIRDIRFQIGGTRQKKGESAPHAEYPVSWDNINIEPAKARWVDQMAAEIADAEIRAAFKRVAVAAQKRQQWSLTAGGKICPACRTVHTAPTEKCFFCRAAEEQAAAVVVRGLLREAPQLTYEQMKAVVPGVDRKIYEAVKNGTSGRPDVQTERRRGSGGSKAEI